MADYALLLHGAASTCDFMSRHFPASILGVRTTISPQQRHDEAAYVDRLVHLVDRLGMPRVVCGVSLGAHIAVTLARHIRPEWLALCLPAAFGGAPVESPTTGATHRDVTSTSAMRAERTRSAVDWVGREVDRAWGLLTDDDLRDGLARGLVSQGPTYEDLARITVPTVVAGWSDDALHPLTVAEQWQSAIPASGLVVVDRRDAESDPRLLARAITGSR